MNPIDFDSPDADSSPLSFSWAVPLDEPPSSAKPLAPESGFLPLPLPYFDTDTPPTEEGFHPRLRRFDEAA